MSRSRPQKRFRRLRALLLAGAALGLVGTAQARTVKIVTADTLELRNIDGQELVVIAGDHVEITLDSDIVRAKRVEFNRTRRTLTLIGQAYYHTARDNQTMTGENLVVDLGSEALTGQDVLISNSQLEIRGQEIERVPGQLRASGGYFTPCARCGRSTNDYAFKAEQLVVYPGDRLVAYRAQFLIAEHPVAYLPVLVLPLNDQARQPRLVIGNGQPDGRTVEADLPFAIGSSYLGTTLLRYYQNRTPRFGGGVDLHGYAPSRWVDRLDLYALALPKPFLPDYTQPGGYARQEGYDFDLKFSVKGHVPLSMAVTPLDYSLLVTRRDIGLTATDPERGVTRADFTAKVEYPLFYFGVNYNNRFGPMPTRTASDGTITPLALSQPLRKPEIYLDPKPFSVGPLNFDFKFTVGDYTASSNPFSRIASATGPNYSTTRLEEAHQISYTRDLWKGADFSVSNAFIGRYYGNGARTVQLDLSGKLTQRWAGSNSISLEQKYIRYEGTSPFYFDSVSRRLSAPLSVTLSTVPTRGATFGVTYTRDAFMQPGAQFRTETLAVSGGVNKLPLSATYGLSYDFSAEQVTTGSYSVTLGDPDSGTATLVRALPAVPATPTSPAIPARGAYYKRSSAWPFPRLTLTASGGYDQNSGIQPITLKATVNGAVRTNYFSVSGVYDLAGTATTSGYPYYGSPNTTGNLNQQRLTSLNTTYSLSATSDTVLNPFTVSGSETLALRYPRLNGTHSLTWRGYTFSTSHDLSLEQGSATESGNVSFSVGNLAGSATNWTLTYGGPYDLQRQGFTRPRLSASLNMTQPGQLLSASAAVNVAGLDQKRTELSQAGLNAAWQKGRFSLAGRATYTRYRSGTYPDDHSNETLVVDPLKVGVAIGKKERPDVYLTASLRQTFTYLDGVRQDPKPLSPVLGLTWDRCCWALQGEYDVGLKRLRIAIGLPGQTYSIFDRLNGSNSYPLQPYLPTR